MKKLICLALCLVLALPLPVRAEETTQTPATEGNPEPPATEHVHTWSEVTVAATCTQAGSITKTCSCGETVVETLAAVGHTFGSMTDGGDGTHSRSCSVCSAVETASHNWGEGQITAAASCTATGTRVYTCSCGATKSETLPITDHPYGEWVVSDESHSRTCVCGKTESGAHSWSLSATIAPTCKEEGIKEYYCATCGAYGYEVLPKLTTHTYDNPCDPHCNICDEIREVPHKYSISTVWSKNSQGHWHACTACGGQEDFGSHYPGPAATEEKAQYCLTCGYMLTAKLGHKHKYASQWSYDESGHWYACSGCDEINSFAAHTYDDGCDPDCNICGYMTTTAHVYSGTWLSDEAGHWDVCTVCGEESTLEPHIPGEDATEDTPQLCLTCGFELAPVTEHVHNGQGDWLQDAEIHWKLCDCGEIAESQPHSWNAGEEQEDTTVLYTCLDCGITRIEGEPKADFPWLPVGLGAAGLLCISAAVLTLLLIRKKPGKYGR